MPVSSAVWELNKQLNDLKIEWATQNAAGNKSLRDKAAADAKKLREDYLSSVDVSNPLNTQGLLKSTDSLLRYQSYDGKDGQFIAVNNNGVVFYQADFDKYTYYEQVHVESKAERVMGSLANAAAGYAIGYFIGRFSKSGAVEHASGVGGVWAMNEYLPGLPDVGERKTMIYRTNINTGKIEHMVIDTNSYNVLKWKHSWKKYS